jgi:hypothetical protein
MKVCTPYTVGIEALRIDGRPASSSSPSLDAHLARAASSVALAAALAATTVGVAAAQVGTNYCSALPNSTGVAASISGTGSMVLSANQLELTGSGLPQNASGYFLCGRTQGFSANPGGSSGNLCLGTPIGRLVGGVVVNSGSSGAVSVQADLTAMPQPGMSVAVLPGETWNFQCWYRDLVIGGGATSNFTDGLRVLFLGGGGAPIQGMMPIPPGTFDMGSTTTTSLSAAPVHRVTISYPFWMGRHEVTREEYQGLMAGYPPGFPGATLPAQMVSWVEARLYCAALTAQQAGSLPAGYEYRLPTEAEWEYACRAGTTTAFHYGPDLFCDQAQFSYSYSSMSSCGLSASVPVESYLPNAFGLYDMHGNVFEWCLDSAALYSAQAVTNPFVTGGTNRIIRGGSWGSDSNVCQSAHRHPYPPGAASSNNGFRVALGPVLVP